MKVGISVFGRFHLFNLAQQLARRGGLAQLITSYPKFETVKYGIPRHLITSILPAEVLSRAMARMPFNAPFGWNSQYFRHQVFEHAAAPLLKPGPDIFVGLSSFSLKPLRRAQSLGMVGIIERGSSHMLFQQQILEEEYARVGLVPKKAHPRVVEQELREYEMADYISIPSSFVERSFIANGVPARKLIRVPYGVNLSAFRRLPKEDRVFRVIHCGGVDVRKGVHYLLQAFAELGLPDAELWLVGGKSPEMAKYLERYGRNVVANGPRPQSELAWYYSQADVFCLASIEEGMAMVQAQAMACGLPIICTTNTGGEDLIREGKEGFVIPIRDVPALKDRIRWCYENREACRAMGDSAMRRVQTGLTWDDYGDKIWTEYSRVSAGRA